MPLRSNLQHLNKKTYFALCSADNLLFSSAWSLSISFFFLSMLRSASIPALACVSLSLLYSFSCSSSCCFSLYKENRFDMRLLRHHNYCRVNFFQDYHNMQNHAQINKQVWLTFLHIPITYLLNKLQISHPNLLLLHLCLLNAPYFSKLSWAHSLPAISNNSVWSKGTLSHIRVFC